MDVGNAADCPEQLLPSQIEKPLIIHCHSERSRGISQSCRDLNLTTQTQSIATAKKPDISLKRIKYIQKCLNLLINPFPCYIFIVCGR